MLLFQPRERRAVFGWGFKTCSKCGLFCRDRGSPSDGRVYCHVCFDARDKRDRLGRTLRTCSKCRRWCKNRGSLEERKVYCIDCFVPPKAVTWRSALEHKRTERFLQRDVEERFIINGASRQVSPTAVSMLSQVQVEVLERGRRWRVLGLYEEDALKLGLRRLDAEWPAEELLAFPKRPDGSPKLMRESILEGLLTRRLELKSIRQIDVSTMLGDMRWLSLRQLLRIRSVHLDFCARGEVFKTHASLLAKIDGLVFERLGRLAAQGDAGGLSIPDDLAARRLGLDAVLRFAAAASLPTGKECPIKWFVCWIGDARAFFHTERFTFTSAFPSEDTRVGDIIDTSEMIAQTGKRNLEWELVLVKDEADLSLPIPTMPSSESAGVDSKGRCRSQQAVSMGELLQRLSRANTA